MAGRPGSTWRRGFNRYAPLTMLLVGLILIVSNLAVTTPALGNYATVIGGGLLVLAGYLYRSGPFLTSERKYTSLRDEVDNFIELVRQLNRTAVAIGGGPEFDEVTDALRESLKRIEELAGKKT